MAILESQMEVFWDNLNGNISSGKFVILDRGNIPVRILYLLFDISSVKLCAQKSQRYIEVSYWFNALERVMLRTGMKPKSSDPDHTLWSDLPLQILILSPEILETVSLLVCCFS